MRPRRAPRTRGGAIACGGRSSPRASLDRHVDLARKGTCRRPCGRSARRSRRRPAGRRARCRSRRPPRRARRRRPARSSPVTPSIDRLERAAAGDRDARAPGGLGLDRGDAELLDRGHHQRAAGREQPRRLASETRPANGSSGRRSVAAGGGRARRRRPPAAAASLLNALHRQVDPLVRHQLGQHEVVVARRRPARSARSRPAGRRRSSSRPK